MTRQERRLLRQSIARGILGTVRVYLDPLDRRRDLWSDPTWERDLRGLEVASECKAALRLIERTLKGMTG